MTRTKAEVLTRIRETGIIPVVRVPSPALAMRAVAAVRQGGVPVVEITMSVPGAIGIIEALVAAAGDEVLVGAGTVLDAATAAQCIRAGAAFIVSPATDAQVIRRCRDEDVVVMPGALTPTEIVHAWTLGADVVKVFPAGAVGGASYLKAIKGPLPAIKLIPTGGVSLDTAAAFLLAGAEAVGVGGDLISIAALDAGEDERIVATAARYAAIVRDVRAKEIRA